MKTIKHLITALLLLCATVATAHDFEVDGIYYNITDEASSTVGVTYQGSSYGECSNEYIDCVLIPESVIYNSITYSVTSIGESAFRGCSGLTSIVICNCVTSIGNYAFYDCTSLKDLRIEDGDSILSLGVNKKGYQDYYTSSMGEGLFCDCPLETLYIGRNLSYNATFSYGYSPFRYTSTLNSITISNRVTKIGSYAFEGCSGLTSIEIPNSVTSIGSYAFSGCAALTSIEIPNSVSSIGNYAFSGCAALNEVRINDITSWFGISFKSSGSNPLFYAKNLYLNDEKVTNLVIPENVTEIKNYTLYNCISLTNIKIHNSVTDVGESAFSGCSGLTSIEIPNSVASIGDYAFYGCTGLKTVVNFSNLTFGKGSSNNGYIAYYADKVYNVPNGSMEGDCVFGVINGVNTLVGYCGGDSEIDLPADYKGENYVIGSEAFENNETLTSVTVSNGVTSIGKNAFYGCASLNDLKIGNRTVSIDEYAFYGCSSLENLMIGDGVKSIEEYAFYNCTNLKEIVFGKRVNYIGDYAFATSNKIETIYALPTRAINCENTTTAFHQNAYKYATLYVRESSLDSYETTEPWSKFYIESIGNFTLTYMIDGELYFTTTVEYGAVVPEIEIPSKEGYTFSGWSEAPETMPAEDVTITGSFSVNTYAITYIVDGEIYATDSLTYGSEIVLIDEPTKEGYTFSWSEVPETMPAEDIEITGSFSIDTYKITYIVDGEVYATDELTYGSEIVLRDEPAKEGHTFSGWSEAPETMPAEDIEITGSFSVNTYAITYIVDGEVYVTDELTYGSEIVLIDEPVKEGYTFSGWSEAPETMPAEDIEITGSFSVNTYKITYIVDGEVYAIDSLAYGSEIVLRDEPTKDGHAFSGWSEAPKTMPAEDIEITGSFIVNTYAITYIVDGEVYATDELTYGSEIVLRDEPTKEGYTFSGWSEAPETMPAEDIEITGSFGVNTYKITYIVDGEVYATDELTYGSEIVLRDEPTKEGYTFSGWSEAPETMPAHDIEITGSFIPTENISEVEMDVNIQITNNGIILLDAYNNVVRVYTINGILVEKIDKYTGEEIVLNKGVYIVCVGDKAVKIKL